MKGSAGPQGIYGEAVAKGDKGDDGAVGPAGPKGDSGQLEHLEPPEPKVMQERGDEQRFPLPLGFFASMLPHEGLQRQGSLLFRKKGQIFP